MGFDSPGLIHNHEVPSSILGPATKRHSHEWFFITSSQVNGFFRGFK